MNLSKSSFAKVDFRYWLKISIIPAALLILAATTIFARPNLNVKAVELSKEDFQEIYTNQTHELTDKKILDLKGFKIYYFIGEDLTLYYYVEPEEELIENPKSPDEVVIDDSVKGETTAGRILGVNLYVNPNGNDSADGKSLNSAFKTIQKAIDTAKPGDAINLATGTYLQNLLSKTNGTKAAPILVRGPRTAIIKGSGEGTRVIEINHDFLTLEGFTIDGLAGPASSSEGFRDKLIYIQGKEALAGVTGLKIRNLSIKNAGGECIRLRYFAQNNEIANNTFESCGVHDFKFGAGGKNGEGVYIGTAPEQTGDGKNPTSDIDFSNNNWVHHNKFVTNGNECVDIKEGSSGNIVEHNVCTGQKDPNSAGLDSRGSGNIFRFNETFNNVGAGIRLGGDSSSDGTKNDIYQNKIYGNKAGGIKFQASSQGKVCGNQFSSNATGDSVGSFGSQFQPQKPC